MASIVFWSSVAVVGYVYVGYAVLLAAWARIREAAVEREATAERPSVSIVIAARNEGPRLAARIENLLSLDYPADRRQIIVVSDGSSDDSLRVLARFPRTVVTVAIPPSGKAVALNAGVARATSDVVVFADARQMFARNALTELAEPFADPRVGGVTGELVLDAESPCRRAGRDRRTAERRHALRADALDRRHAERRRTLRSTIADGVGLYWRYEKQLRRLESAVDSTLGATGAIYAIRRSLYEPLLPDTVLDDVATPMRIVLKGYRVVFNERARAFDRAAIDADLEAQRKIRTLAGNYQILALEPRLLSPWANRVWLQYVSHKVGRLAVPYALLSLFAASVTLAADGAIYAIALAGQVVFYLFAGLGAIIEWRARAVPEALNQVPATRYPVPTAREVA